MRKTGKNRAQRDNWRCYFEGWHAKHCGTRWYCRDLRSRKMPWEAERTALCGTRYARQE